MLPPTSLPTPEDGPYQCECRGFVQNDPRYFCLRCLEAWTAGLQRVFMGERLEREMRKAAGILAARLKDDPAMARLNVNDALRAAERPL